MNLFTTALIVFIVTTPIAQAVEKGQKKSGSTTAKQTNAKWQPTTFTDDTSQLPEKYNGVDAKKFHALFKEKTETVKKDEFETTADFAQRTGDKDSILNPISTLPLYAFRIEKFHSKYDADSQTYTLGTDSSYNCEKTSQFGKSKGWITCPFASIQFKIDTYNGSNAFGKSTTIQRIRGLNVAIAIQQDNQSLTPTMKNVGDDYKWNTKLYMPLEKARTLKDKTIAAIYVGQISDAKMIEGKSTSISPTLSLPFDTYIEEDAIPLKLKKIVFYIYETGEILDQKIIN